MVEQKTCCLNCVHRYYHTVYSAAGCPTKMTVRCDCLSVGSFAEVENPEEYVCKRHLKRTMWTHGMSGKLRALGTPAELLPGDQND